MANKRRIYLYDTTLRDGAQTHGVDFSVTEKRKIAEALDDLGIDYIEGGFPGANPTDDRFFNELPSLQTSHMTAFGMTRRADRSTSNDPALSAVLNSDAKHYCLVGKSSAFHVKVALGISNDDNLDSIGDSIAACAKSGEAMFDAEHFFDGYKENKDYALACIKAAYDNGARWVVLCDTNGGTLPHEVEEIVSEAAKHVPPDHLGIHTHDDTGNAIANSLAALKAGCCMVQGTLNGLGERCGNANLISLIPTLMLKMDYDIGLQQDDLKKLPAVSRMLDEILNRPSDTSAPYVGERAFIHKGGLHASAMQKDSSSYEHIAPEVVGNKRLIVVSDQAGRSNILARFAEIGIDVDPKDPSVQTLVDLVKDQEYMGYAYDSAEASFEVLARKALGTIPRYFSLKRFSVTDERRYNAEGNLVTESEASIKVKIGSDVLHTVSEGNGPVNALDRALRKALIEHYPLIENLYLSDYRVRILMPQDATAAVTRVLIESGTKEDMGRKWSTVGVSGNIIDASYNALRDSYIYYLMKHGVQGA
ncbi:MAG: citramalate synthase [Alphaproteobacteria bacterium]|jgi:2-isopropylmalate synthase|nr:citramalate synthase [Alphaproteobacteria bacterium]MDP7222407.1 citramalate synthase [Alphaproteobacteria bacterium]